MLPSQQLSLKSNNSFNISAIAKKIYFPSSITDLNNLPDLSLANFYILGDGSNTLFIDHEAPIIIKPIFKGISIIENDENFILTVGAGENWHDLVCYCIDKGIYGLENLALIPGSVGAAPVQNIGAYGVEFSDFCMSVQWYDLFTRKVKTFTKKDCQFGYRDSIFKKELRNKGLITKVIFSFSKIWQAKITYNGLDNLSPNVLAKDIMEAVISLRKKKLPDPQILPNAGSFFKNPIVCNLVAKKLLEIYPEMPFYPLDNTTDVKLAAGWLIEKSGLKGFCYKNVGVHKNQALVLVNYSADFGGEIISLAKYVQASVQNKFKVLISPEVRIISSSGEIDFLDITDYDVIEKDCDD